MTSGSGAPDVDRRAHGARRGGWLRSRAGTAFLGFLAVAGFFLLTEHTAHVFGALPFLLLLACPLLHLFMHGGHRDGGAHGDHRQPHDQQGR